MPLLELLDPRFGLGPLGPPTGPAKPAPAARRNQLLLDLACRALRERQPVLELDHELARQLATWAPGPETAPSSLELYLGIAASSAAAIDAGDFTLVVGHGPGVSPAGRNLGRFADLLAPPGRAAPARPGVAVAELVYLPRRLRQANVAVRPAGDGFELAVGTSPGVPADRVIPLDELAVGVRDGRLRVWWPAGGAEVEVTAGHMLSPTEAPAVARFLAEVGRDGLAQLGGFSWGPAAGFPYLPRVQAGRVASARSWRLDPGAAIGRWRGDWKYPVRAARCGRPAAAARPGRPGPGRAGRGRAGARPAGGPARGRSRARRRLAAGAWGPVPGRTGRPARPGRSGFARDLERAPAAGPVRARGPGGAAAAARERLAVPQAVRAAGGRGRPAGRAGPGAGRGGGPGRARLGLVLPALRRPRPAAAAAVPGATGAADR